MVGVDLVMAALSVGAGVVAQVATEAVRGAYDRLAGLLWQRIGRRVTVTDLTTVSREQLRMAIKSSGVDPEVLAASLDLLDLVDRPAAMAFRRALQAQDFAARGSEEEMQQARPDPLHGVTVQGNQHGVPRDEPTLAEPPRDKPFRDQPRWTLVAQAPARVPVGEAVSLVVRIAAEGRPVHPDAITAGLAKLSVAPAGTPVTITVNASRGLLADGPLQATIRVLPDADPEPVLFGFRAARPGLHQLLVTAWAGGTFLAEVTVETSVSAGGSYSDAAARVAPLGDLAARRGEATMEVRFDGTGHTFQLRSDTTLFDPVEFAVNAPGAAVERAIQALQRLAAGGSRYGDGTTRHWIKAIGVDLWQEMVPAEVREQFWQIRDDVRALTIATNHDVVPWEILYPLDARHDDGFLVERVPVLRRTYGQHRSGTVGLGGARYVVSKRRPTGAEAEIAAVRGLIGGDGTPITSVDALLGHLGGGRPGALHFACHNAFDQAGSRIDLTDGPFVPELLAVAEATRQLAATSPLIFLNACRSAGTAPSFTRMTGWAQRFMAAGAGAFVGTLWDVRTESSAQFATAFYERLAAGATLGDAVRGARTRDQDDVLDPTWLAYSVYGDPFATAA